MPGPTKYVEREIPQISLRDFPNRIDSITAQLCDAAEHVGFFGLADHGIAAAEIDAMFALSEAFFRLPAAVKATVPWSPRNAGWEDRSQVRPSNVVTTSKLVADNKESYQLQFGDEAMRGLWLAEDDEKRYGVPGFRARCTAFMHRLQAVSEQLMVCFARGLGFDDDEYFVRLHDAARPDSQSVLRLLHYYDTPRGGGDGDGEVCYRAGAHTDWGFLTLLFQREGQGGLEICPGRESATEFGADAAWTRVKFTPDSNSIVCNIGNLLMSWSDDRFRSTLHRVKAPSSRREGEGGKDEDPDDYYGERFSIAFFNQPCRSAVIQGPKKKYPPVTGEEFIARAMDTHFAALKKATLEAEVQQQQQKAY
ncbi:hypothetical protein SLS62_009262 [Diatrype stigma]|uniref:Fe2OG dioxygenase domain-containing protein n=1 Tax=Diatrype stigma TaxID=117547 RepID=A0AAN9YLR4_9PEZI